MTVFIIAAIILIAATALALARPLWHGARAWALAALVIIPTATGGLYLGVGTPAALDPEQVAAAATDATGAAELSIDQALTALRTRLQQQPDDLEGWLLLGRTLRFQQDFPGARDAFMRAFALAPESAEVLVETAEAMVMASERPLIEGEPLAMIQRALEIDPDQQRGLLLLGAHHIQAGRAEAGLVHWQRLLELAPPESLPSLRQRIDEVRAEAGLPALPPTAAETAETAEARSLTIELDISPALAETAAALPDSAQVFVLARRIDGAGPPLAAKRLPLGPFPRTIVLGDADNPMAAGSLFEQPRIRLIARISRRGGANAEPGDLEGSLEIPAEAGTRIALSIDRVIE